MNMNIRISTPYIHELIIVSHNYQLSVGPIAQLVEHCTAIAEVRVRVPFKPEFFAIS